MAATRDIPPTLDESSDRLLAGRYRFIRLLGEGGTGQVFLAEDCRLARRVAIKAVRPSLCDNVEVCRRLERECRLHAAIGVHPNIVALHDRIDDQGRIYLVMEYVRGQTLAGLLAGQAPLPLEPVVGIVDRILVALVCIHGHGIIHRDIKTSNLMVRIGDETMVKLMDFGIACEEESEPLTRLDSQGPGTPAYMAPERIDPQKFGQDGPATDLYSVGVILYEMLAGHPPFQGSISEIFHGHLARQPDLSLLGLENSGLTGVVARALAKEPEHRFTDAEAFRHALAGVLRDQGRAGQGPVAVPTLLHCGEGDGSRQPDHTLADPVPAGPAGGGRQWLALAAAVGLFLLLALAAYLGLHRQVSAPGTNVTETGPGDTVKPPAAAAKDAEPGRAAQEGEIGRSALKELENRRGKKPAAKGEQAATETSSDWEIIEIRDRRIR